MNNIEAIESKARDPEIFGRICKAEKALLAERGEL